MYCLKCKTKTKSMSEHKENKDGKWRLITKYGKCDSKKSQYIKASKYKKIVKK